MNDHTERLNAFTSAIAEHLGEGWHVARPASVERTSSVELSDGTRRLQFYYWANSKKVEVQGIYADVGHAVWLPAEMNRPEINVSITRDPAGAAADIKRRLIHRYDIIAQLVNVLVAEREDQNQRLYASTCAIADALSTKRPDPPDNDHVDKEVSFFRSEGPYGEWRANHNGTSYEIKLRSVPEQLALEIAKLVGDVRA